MKPTLLLSALVVLTLAACGQDAAAPVEGPTAVTIIENGGCAMMGPNCATWTLSPDGSFTLSRTGEDGVVAESSISAETAQELFDEIASTDMETFIASLGEGSCQACVDGIDTRVEIEGPAGQTVLDSTEVGFDESPLFVLMDEVRSAMQEAAELPIEQR